MPRVKQPLPLWPHQNWTRSFCYFSLFLPVYVSEVPLIPLSLNSPPGRGGGSSHKAKAGASLPARIKNLGFGATGSAEALGASRRGRARRKQTLRDYETLNSI